MKTRTFLTIASILVIALVVNSYTGQGTEYSTHDLLASGLTVSLVGFVLYSGVKVLQSWNDGMPSPYDGEQ